MTWMWESGKMGLSDARARTVPTGTGTRKPNTKDSSHTGICKISCEIYASLRKLGGSFM